MKIDEEVFRYRGKKIIDPKWNVFPNIGRWYCRIYVTIGHDRIKLRMGNVREEEYCEKKQSSRNSLDSLF
nr:hypothetical protein [Candidatus Sigynarchaeota archaeon]